MEMDITIPFMVNLRKTQRLTVLVCHFLFKKHLGNISSHTQNAQYGRGKIEKAMNFIANKS